MALLPGVRTESEVIPGTDVEQQEKMFVGKVGQMLESLASGMSDRGLANELLRYISVVERLQFLANTQPHSGEEALIELRSALNAGFSTPNPDKNTPVTQPEE